MSNPTTRRSAAGAARSGEGRGAGRRALLKAGVAATGGIAAVYAKPTLRGLGVPRALAVSGGPPPPPPPPPPLPPVLSLTVAPSTISIGHPPPSVTLAWGGFPVGRCENIAFDGYVAFTAVPIAQGAGSRAIPVGTCLAGWGSVPGAHTATIAIVDCTTKAPTGAAVAASVTLTP